MCGEGSGEGRGGERRGYGMGGSEGYGGIGKEYQKWICGGLGVRGGGARG